ncbi:hypothetical protein GLS40_07905 [Pseudooceanicola sp. 216_PA32_1]|uniref:Uncharacterized protein n=1 Tax=Pseudooceanicola pacificus TaxID=2676438 RepID=A0A844WCJ9_9RHOB|nr:hypothetical protein [Pseudooceanicola pacificus]MWB77942.1 hypothetical protein [Pseudooceanicola pacificus]
MAQTTASLVGSELPAARGIADDADDGNEDGDQMVSDQRLGRSENIGHGASPIMPD